MDMRSANTTAKSRTAPRWCQAAGTGTPDDAGMKREIRLALFERALDRMLSDHENHDFVVFELRGRPDSYVQLMLHDGAILGEVGSRGWMAESQQLATERATALGCLGFDRGGLKANFARDHLPYNARRLACLTELLFGAAYRPATDFDVTVLTRELIEAEAAQRRCREVDA